jgi:aspartate/methionine/tyrosine aminotransferase
MTFPEFVYLRWIKSLSPARINLARSGVDLCPPSLLGLNASDLVVNLPVQYGYAPLRKAIARRYGVAFEQAYAVSGGTSFATWVACAAALDGAARDTEVIVERPTYEPLLLIPQSFGARVRRLDRRRAQEYAIDLDRFAALITPKTRLAIVGNLHNPTGARIDMPTLRAMADMLARAGAWLLVDEVYLECDWGRRTASCVHAGPNVITTSSLTKAYGLDGLRAGWILGPEAFIERVIKVHSLVANNGVAPGERLTVAAFRQLPKIRARAQALLGPNLERVREYFARETRLSTFMPDGGNVLFPRLPAGLDADLFADHLRARYDTQVVPGRFFETPGHIRISFGFKPSLLDEGLRNLSRALDDLAPGLAPAGRRKPAAKAEASRRGR